MYDIDNITIQEVLYVDQFEDFYEVFKNCDQSMSAFSFDTSVEAIRSIISRPNTIFLNVYYEKVLTGYILLELRSTKSADFHWGLLARNKYLPKIIQDVFKHCCKMNVENFIGWTPSSNKMALKIAGKMGFEILSEIPNYYQDGGATTLSVYKNEVKDG